MTHPYPAGIKISAVEVNEEAVKSVVVDKTLSVIGGGSDLTIAAGSCVNN